MAAPADPDFRHALPPELEALLDNEPALAAKWQALTPLARNEWICWTISVKRDETRAKHVAQALENLAAGKRRPCCWPGCPHRERRGASRLPDGS